MRDEGRSEASHLAGDPSGCRGQVRSFHFGRLGEVRLSLLPEENKTQQTVWIIRPLTRTPLPPTNCAPPKKNSWTLHRVTHGPLQWMRCREKKSALGCLVPPGSPTHWPPVMPRKRRRVSPPEVVSGLRSRMGVGGWSCGKLAEAAGSSRESGKNDIKPGKMQAGWRAECEGGRRGRRGLALRTQSEG